MSRRHSKKHTQKSPVKQVLITPAVVSDTERAAVECTFDTPTAIPIVQDDGSVKFFTVGPKVIQPARYKNIALNPTTTRGAKNDPKNMAPKGKAGQKK